MSIAVLTQVYDEMRRLAIAGSVVAGGDFRLKKLIPPLEQAGAKAPVFARIALAVKSLVESTEQASAQALLELCALVNAVLSTQGETGLAGEFQPLETVNLGSQTTQAGARILKPLLEALTTTGSGRLEIIRDSFERGAFHDLRLVKPALEALDDPYPDIGEFIADKVLPFYGKAILPELRSRFDLKGKSGHLRRLALMHRLDPVGTREIVKQALDEGSREMKVAAIECLGDSPEEVAYLLEQSKAKSQEVRGAALKALSKVNANDAIEALQQALAGTDLNLAVDSLRENRNPKLLQFVISEVEQQVAAVFQTKDKKELGKSIERLLSLLQCLEGRDDKSTESLLLKLFQRRDDLLAVKAEPSGQDVNNRVAESMAVGSKKVRQTLVDAHATVSPELLGTAFEAACRTLKPAAVFDTFSPYLLAKVDGKKKDRDPAWAKQSAIVGAITDHGRGRYHSNGDEEAETVSTWDSRWLDAATQIKHVELACTLARPDHAACNALLSEEFAGRLKSSKDLYECHEIVQTMIRVQHPAATDAVIAALKKHAVSKLSWGVYWVGRMIPDLPKTALAPLEELLPTLNDKAIDQLVEYVTALKNKP